MLTRLWNRLYGYERLKHRGDCFFLAGEPDRARSEYLRARSVLSDSDYRAPALDALIRECASQRGAGASLDVREGEVPEDEAVHQTGLEDLFELAIAEKPGSRALAYRSQGRDFKAGYVALVQGQADRAVDLLRRAASHGASSFVRHLELGRALSLAGRMEEALEALRVAEQTAPHDAECVLLLSAVQIELGRFEEAHERLVGLLAAGHDDPEVIFLLGRALAGLGRSSDALETFRRVVKMDPRFHEAYFEGGRLMLRSGDVEAAFQLYNRACSLAPDEVRYNRELARLVMAHPLDEEAGLAACDRLMVTDEARSWEYLHWIGELYIRRGWRREARDPLRKSLELVPPERKSERLVIEQRLSSLSS